MADIRTVDGRALHAERAGTGGPTVVFEAGMGASRWTWAAVAPRVSAATSTVVYDRSGLGRSPEDAATRDLDRLVSDHIDVLEAVGGEGFVLVGHSWGGPIVRKVASLRPDLVQGLVLVDQTDELCPLFFTRANAIQTRLSAPMLPVLARLGLVRQGVKRLAANLPAPAAVGMLAEDGTLDAVRTQQAEIVGSMVDLARLRDEPLTMPDIPVTVISGLMRSWMEGKRRDAIIDAHRQRAASLPQGRHVGAARSSHYVPLTDAPLVADEILRVVEIVRGSRAR